MTKITRHSVFETNSSSSHSISFSYTTPDGWYELDEVVMNFLKTGKPIEIHTNYEIEGNDSCGANYTDRIVFATRAIYSGLDTISPEELDHPEEIGEIPIDEKKIMDEVDALYKNTNPEWRTNQLQREVQNLKEFNERVSVLKNAISLYTPWIKVYRPNSLPSSEYLTSGDFHGESSLQNPEGMARFIWTPESTIEFRYN